MNFFHVSVPDIDVYSGYRSDGMPDQQGSATMMTRHIRHEYVEDKEDKASFTNSLGMTFNRIPAGAFMMGSPEDEP